MIFFSKTEFYSSFKNEVTSDEEYKNMKKFWPFLLLKKISKLSDIYNFQDTIIICEFFENRAKEMTKKFSYNSQKCTSTSSLYSPIFAKGNYFIPKTQTFISGFNCVNT